MKFSTNGWRTTVRTALCAAALGIACGTSPALARPGTPNSVEAYQCWDYKGIPQSAGWWPAVCVQFQNTAKEKVRFEAEVTANGQPYAIPDPSENVRCRNPEQGAYNCTVGMAIAYPSLKPTVQVGKSGIPWGDVLLTIPGANVGAGIAYWADPDTRKKLNRKEGGAHPGEAFIVKNLEFDTTYCFRFRTRDEDDDVSLLWSNWGCTKTIPKPGKPERPSVSIYTQPLKYEKRRIDGKMRDVVIPNTLVFGWGYYGGRWPTYPGVIPISHAEVQVSSSPSATDLSGRAIAANEMVAKPEGGIKFEISPELAANGGMTYYAHVCVVNVSGKACAKADNLIVNKPKTPGDVDYGKVEWPDARKKIPNGDITTKPTLPTTPDDVGPQTSQTAPNSSPVPPPVDNPYVGGAKTKPKGPSHATDSIFARPKQSKNVNDMYAGAPSPSSDDIYLRSAEAAAPVNFAATWDTITAANGRYTMTLKQSGMSVTGSYVGANGAGGGSLAGSIEGDTLTYRWEEGANSGTGKFKLSADGGSFTGWWNYSATNPDAVEGSWNGTRN